MILFSGHADGSKIILSGEMDEADAGLIRVALIFRDGRTESELNWPKDFEPDPAAGETIRVRKIDVDQKLGPLINVELRSKQIRMKYDKAWHLIRLFPSSAEEFERRYFRKKHREPDVRTHFFALKQILRFYRENLGHRCVATVIFAYRAVDIGDDADFDEGVDALRDLIRQTGALERTSHPRTDRDHLTGSLFTGLWLLLLARGRFDECFEALEDYVQRQKGFDQSFSGVVLNGSLAILLYGYLLRLKGRDEDAFREYDYNHKFYVHHLPRLTPSAIWFNEMLQAHKAVAYGLLTKRSGYLEPATGETSEVLALAHRVNTERGRTLLDARFAELKQAWSVQASREAVSNEAV